MSTNTIRNNPPAYRPPTGAPWWIWVLVGGCGLMIVGMLIKRVSPEDGAVLYKQALDAGEAGDRDLMMQRVEQLRQYPAYSGHVNFLEGVNFLGRSAPLKAIPLLKKATETPEVRSKATLSLGRAYGTAGQLDAAIKTLESVSDDPEDGKNAIFVAAGMLASSQAWDAAVEKLRTLEKAGFQKPSVLYQLAEIEFDRGNHAEAEKLYIAAIDAYPADPTNSVKASKLLDCRIQLGTMANSDKYINMLDNQMTSGMYRAESLMAEGKLKEARAAIDRSMRESEGNPALGFLRGKLALAENTPDAAKQVLPEVLVASMAFPRALDGMRVTAKVAALAGDSELADKARQNVEALEAIRAQMRELMPTVGSSYTDLEVRYKLAQLALECGESELTQKVFRGLLLFHPELEGELMQRRMKMEESLPILVPFGREVSLPTNRGRLNEPPPSEPPPAGAPFQRPPVDPQPPK